MAEATPIEIINRESYYSHLRLTRAGEYCQVLMSDGSIAFVDIKSPDETTWKPYGEFLRITPDGLFSYKPDQTLQYEHINRLIAEHIVNTFDNIDYVNIMHRYRKPHIIFRTYEMAEYASTDMNNKPCKISYERGVMNDYAINDERVVMTIRGGFKSGATKWVAGAGSAKQPKYVTVW